MYECKKFRILAKFGNLNQSNWLIMLGFFWLYNESSIILNSSIIIMASFSKYFTP